MCQKDNINTLSKTPLVSILMPVYNNEAYVKEAIDSMLCQTLSDFELIVLDDCSTDNSAEVIRGIDDKRIIYHCNEQNLGLANNLNVGLKMAKGKYIARMDGDDISLPERLQIQVDFLEKNRDIALCSCGLEKFGTENDVWIREKDPEKVKITMMFFSPVLHATSVWRKEEFEKNNLYYNQDAFPAEDYDLWSRAIFHCKLVNIPKVLYKYRIHGIQVTKTDDRTENRDKKIREKYLKSALPSLSDKDRENFIERFVGKKEVTVKNVKELKGIYQKVIQANDKDQFFEKKRLKKRLKRYYQGIVLLKLKDAPIQKNLSLIFQLRLVHLYLVMKQSNSLLGEFLRFGLIGAIATGINYVVYFMLYKFIDVKIAYTIGYVVSFIFNFIASNLFTFKTKLTFKKIIGFSLSHFVNYLLHIAVFSLLLALNFSVNIIPFIVDVIVIPVNFILVRLSLKPKE